LVLLEGRIDCYSRSIRYGQGYLRRQSRDKILRFLIRASRRL
jgi:hypothetical protein